MSRTGHDRVADVQRAALDEHRRHRATTLVQVRLDGDTLGVHLRVGPQIQRSVGGQDDRLEQGVETDAGDGGDVDEHGVAAVLLRHQAVLGQLATDLGRVRAFLVDLVDRDHDRYVRGQRVVQRLDRLRHHTVVGRNHQHGDVGRLRTTGTHGGERLVTRGVDEGDLALVTVDLGRDLVRTDGLGDATGLASDDVGLADRVQQLRLAMVDVTHDRDDRRTLREVFLAALVLAELDVEALQQLAVLVLGRDDLDVVVELRAEHLEGLVGDRLGGRHHLAQVEQHLDQRRHVNADLLAEVGQAGATGEPDLLAVTLPDAYATDLRRLHLVELLTTLLLGLATTTSRTARTTEGTLGAAAAAATATPAGRATAADRRRDRRDRGAAAAAGATPTAGRTRPTAGPRSTAGTAERGLLGHHRRVRAGHAGHATAGPRTARRTAGRRPAGGRGPPGRDASWPGRGPRALAHALGRGERVVTGTRCATGAPPRARYGTRKAAGRTGPRALTARGRSAAGAGPIRPRSWGGALTGTAVS